jgi:hypothetical protein
VELTSEVPQFRSDRDRKLPYVQSPDAAPLLRDVAEVRVFGRARYSEHLTLWRVERGNASLLVRPENCSFNQLLIGG